VAENRFEGSLRVKPHWASLGNMRVSAQVEQQPSEACWNVTVLVSRPAYAPAIQGQAVGAELKDRQGRVIEALSRPSGSLLELGEELQITTEIAFAFDASASPPATLSVTYEGLTVHFRLVPAKRRRNSTLK
jgi:hypothetical protein